MTREQARNNLRDMIVLSLFAAMMVMSDQLMNFLPNIHLIAMFIILLTRFYRAKALISIYLFVILDGIIEGFFLSTWIMYAYIWALLWLWVMILPKKIPRFLQAGIYPILGALHGITFGLFTAPVSYFMFFPGTHSLSGFLAYVASGLPFDIAHMIGNFCACILVLPILEMMLKLRSKKLI